MRKRIFGCAIVCWLSSAVAFGAGAEDYDPSIHARDSLMLTLERHQVPAASSPSLQGLREHAAMLMTIKNAMSLYRDGYLSPEQRAQVASLIAGQKAYVGATLAQAQDWPVARKAFLRTMQYHAFAASELIELPATSTTFKGLMDAYHSGIGYEAYRAAQDLGVDQYWETAL